MDYLLLAFNVLILLFWVRLWSAPDREFYFNPFLSGTVRLTDSALLFLRPALGLPDRLAALLLLLVLLAFKTLLAGRLGHAWTLTAGNLYAFTAPAGSDGWGPHFLRSALDTAAFLIRLWTVFLLVALLSGRQRATRAAEALAFFCRPFSRLPLLAQPLALVALHGALVLVASRTSDLSTLPQPGQPGAELAESPFTTGPLFAQALRTGWLAALSFADGLSCLMRALIACVIGNFGASILQARAAMVVCHESVELLLGRFARSRGTTGLGLDFTPLIFFFVVSVLYDTTRLGLFRLIQSSLFN